MFFPLKLHFPGTHLQNIAGTTCNELNCKVRMSGELLQEVREVMNLGLELIKHGTMENKYRRELSLGVGWLNVLWRIMKGKKLP